MNVTAREVEASYFESNFTAQVSNLFGIFIPDRKTSMGKVVVYIVENYVNFVTFISSH